MVRTGTTAGTRDARRLVAAHGTVRHGTRRRAGGMERGGGHAASQME